MKKITMSVAVAAAMLSSGAQAALPVIDNATTLKLYVSGATAAANFIDKLVASNLVDATDKICDSSQPIWRFRDLPNTEHFAIYCKANNTAVVGQKNPNLPTGAANANLLIYKRNTGGSGAGVTPVAQNTPLQFLDLNTCTQVVQAVAGGTIGDASCTGLTPASGPGSIIPDLGLSDVDPIQFKGDNAINAIDISDADVDKLTVKSASALVFGVPLTLDLFKVLQAAQKVTLDVPGDCLIGDKTERCLPSLSRDVVASIHAGNWVSWNNLKVGNSASALGLYDWALTQTAPVNAFGGGTVIIKDLATSDVVHICRRENGSGTQAQSNIKFLGNGCSSVGLSPLPATDVDFVEADGVPMVHAMSSSGRVDACMQDLQTGLDTAANFSNTYGKRWAVGIQSLEKVNANYEFIKVDGVAPTLDNVVEGKYWDWVENTFQYRNSTSANALAGAKLTLADAIIKSAGAPGVMADLNNSFVHAYGNGAYLAVPSNHAPVNGRFDSARPVTPFSHAVKVSDTDILKSNACRVPTSWGDAASKL